MNRKYIKQGNLKKTGIKDNKENCNKIDNLKNREALFYNNGTEKHRELAENLNEMIVEVTPDGRVIYANNKAYEKTGYTREDVEKGINIAEVIAPEDRRKLKNNFSNLFKGKKLTRSVYTLKRKDGSTFPIMTYPYYILDSEENVIGIRELLVDLTGIISAEKKLKESEESYRLLFENSLDGIYKTTLKGKYIDANPALVKMLGYISKEELIKIDIPTQLYVRKEDRPSPGERDRIFEAQLKRKDGSIVTVEINSRVAYREGKPVHYEGMVRDITQRKITEEKLIESYNRLHKTLNDVINTLASIVEVRDPYTSGHQKRVAFLATAIAKEMGLENSTVESIKIAALIHDIGKINLPASILTRPGRLSEIEYDMVKTHSQFGYDMIRKIEFPWPIADIVLQHHERINGTGYPGGIKGKDIRLEAKILGVADVIEAMASHRPYRPALGINKALEEINKGKGKLYDSDVADACNRIIKNKKFKFETDFRPYI